MTKKTIIKLKDSKLRLHFNNTDNVVMEMTDIFSEYACKYR